VRRTPGEQVGECRLTDPAEAELVSVIPSWVGGEKRIRTALERSHEAGLPVALLGQSLDPGRPDPHHGELRGGEERIQQDEREGECDEERVGDHPAGRNPCRGC
jgi:hypothetical protein